MAASSPIKSLFRPQPTSLLPQFALGSSSLVITSVEAEAAGPTQTSDAGSSSRKAVDAAGIFPKNGPDPSARSWGHHRSGITFTAQHKLPKQPLPSLESSCKKYLAALKPLQSASEHNASAVAVRNFLREEGPILQAQLMGYDKSHANWLEHFWYEAFLIDDLPLVMNLNPFCTFKEDPSPSRNDQITRAASLVRSTLTVATAIRQDRWPPDEIRGVPLCMNQHWWMFGVARVPGDDGGRIRLDPVARHIIVLCRGQIYCLYVLEESSNHIIDEHDLSLSLQYIVNDANSIPIQESSRMAIGLLTTEDQKVWSRCRTVLVHEGLRNGENFGIIDSSLFALCLDDSSPTKMSEVCKNMLCGTDMVENGVQMGTCVNRWYNKLAFIVCRNGAAGVNFEHTCADGSVHMGLASDIYKGSLLESEHAVSSNSVLSSNPTVTLPLGGPPSPDALTASLRKLEWDVPTEICTALHLAEKRLEDQIQRHQVETLDLRDYGRALIKSMGFSPDALVQMTLHAAYYGLYGRVENGFEPVQMRQYQHGRSDVIRTATPEAAAFAHIFGDVKASTAEKIESLHHAAGAHVAQAQECTKGLGHHRHLYVLHQMWKRRHAFLEADAQELAEVGGHINSNQKQLPTATIFTDPGWARLDKNVLMTSNVENDHLEYVGYGPAADNGFSIFYFIRQDHTRMTVCSRNGQAKRMIDAINLTFQEIRSMIRLSQMGIQTTPREGPKL